MTAPVQAVARLLLAPLMLIALALLAKGFADVGDGFAAGLVAAIAVLIQYVAFGAAAVERELPVRHASAAAFAGLLLMLAIAVAPLLRGEPLLTQLPPAGVEPVKVGTVELVTALLFDLGVFLLVLGAAVGAMRAVARQAAEGEPEGGS